MSGFLSVPAALLAILLLISGSFSCRADDVGLITAKLTERADHSYLLEADVPPQLQNSLGVPRLPEGFKSQPTEFEQRGALINVRYPFTGETSLEPGHTILLPWSRNGVLVNTRWQDGSRSSHMFPATIKGIEIEIDQLKTVKKSRGEAIREGFHSGIESVSHNWMLWLPILCIGFLFPGAQAIRFLAMLLAGFAASLIILDAFAVAIPSSIGLSAMMAAVILAAILPESRLSPMFAAAACILGMAGSAPYPTEPRIAYIFGITLLFLAAGAGVILIRRVLPSKLPLKSIGVILGGLAFAAILITLVNQPAATQPVAAPPPPMLTAAKPKATKAPGNLDKPFVAFATIEPYEVRFEIMATGKAMTGLLDFPLATAETIQTSEQAQLKEKALAEFAQRFALNINGTAATPELQRADFLTLGAAGAFTRTEAVEEALSTAILGLTFVYPLPAPPSALALTWKQLPNPGTELPATILEPSGSTGFSFSAEQLTLNWKNESDELRPSSIAAVDVNRPTWAPVSLLLLIAGLVLTAKTKESAGYICLALSLLATPFVRSSLPLASPLPEEQADEVVEHLLTNIYRSFDFRNESTIYDQLAISVTGDQLTQIYLGQRQALELENRGGARARVENVDVESIESLEPSGDGVNVHARWNVSGSVNHFGHTHYRQNAYDAILHLTPVDGAWKISSIEVNEEKRIY